MSTSTYVRKPKESPKKGDVFKVGKHTIFVDRKNGIVIHYRTTADRTNSPRYMNIERFRQFIKDAEILEEGK